MKHVTVLQISLGAVVAAHTIGESRWKLCVSSQLPMLCMASVAEGKWHWGPQGQHTAQKGMQVSSATACEWEKSSFPCALVTRTPACFIKFYLQYCKVRCSSPFLRFLTGLGWEQLQLQVKEFYKESTTSRQCFVLWSCTSSPQTPGKTIEFAFILQRAGSSPRFTHRGGCLLVHPRSLWLCTMSPKSTWLRVSTQHRTPWWQYLLLLELPPKQLTRRDTSCLGLPLQPPPATSICIHFCDALRL